MGINRFLGKIGFSREAQVWLVVWLAAILMISGSVVAMLSSRDSEMESWRSLLASMTLGVQEHVDVVASVAYTSTESLVEMARKSGALSGDQNSFRERVSTKEMHDDMRRLIARNQPVLDVATFVADDGTNLNFTRHWPVKGINLADRDYFKALNVPGAKNTFVSQPVKNKGNGKWTFYLARKVESEKGGFLGVVLVGFSVDSISAFHERLAKSLGERASISLYRDDMTLLSRWPYKEDVMGKRNINGPLGKLATEMGETKKTHAEIYTRLPKVFAGDGVPDPRIIAVRRSEKTPLIIAIVVPEETVLARWRSNSILLICAVLGAVFLMFLAGRFQAGRIRSDKQSLLIAQDLAAKAEAASIAKSNFLATMSHELRTPLNGILGMAELIRMDEALPSDARDYASIIETSGKTLLDLLNDILDLSKVEAHKMTLTPSPVNLRDLLETVVSQFRSVADAKGILLKIEWDGPEIREADGLRVRQILSNLVSNAIKFTDSGEVSISAQSTPERIVFSITDTGIGIPEGMESFLFQRFSQVDSSSTRRHGGSGLGLSIVAGLCSVMGGSARFERPEQGGSRFIVSLDLPISTSPSEEPLPKIILSDDAKSKTVLVVDDVKMNRVVLGSMLTKLGYEVEYVENGEDSVERAGAEPRPSLILMDVHMPGMSGLEATELIRRKESELGIGRVPIVGCTASTFESDRESCRDAGMDAFLAKPVSLDSLSSILSETFPKN